MACVGSLPVLWPTYPAWLEAAYLAMGVRHAWPVGCVQLYSGAHERIGELLPTSRALVGALAMLQHSRLGEHPFSPAQPFLLALSSCVPASCVGSANQTRAFAAGTGQSAARICWKRETLRGKAVTKAFHCRQMLSVCADFSCF